MSDVAKLRVEFTKLRRNALYAMSAEEFDSQCAELANVLASANGDAKPTPEQWVTAAKAVEIKCPECNGSGRYQWGACINGKMQHSGPCFRCQSKGRQTQEDFTRNWGYDNFHRKIS